MTFSQVLWFSIHGIGSSAKPGCVCETCGMSYEEFKKVGKLGCSNCYKTYGDRLVPLLRRLHGIYNTMESFRPEPLEVLKFPEKLRN